MPENKYLQPPPPSKFTLAGESALTETPPVTESGSPEKPVCNHCWHGTGMILTSYPPQTQDRCCYCGEYRNRSTGQFDIDVKHGPHVPKLGQWVGFKNV